MADSNESATGFSITGGFGRVQFTLAEIEATAQGIALVGSELGDIASTLSAELAWLSDFCEKVAAVRSIEAGSTYFYSAQAIYALRSASLAVSTCHGAVTELAAHAADAVRRYADAEASVVASEQLKRTQAVLDGTAASGWGLLASLKMGWQTWDVLRDGHRDGMRGKAEDLLNDGPAFLMGLLGPSVGLGYLLTHRNYAGRAKSGVVPADVVRKTFDWTGLSTPGHLKIRQVSPMEWNKDTRTWPPGHALPGIEEGVAGVVDPSFKGVLSGSRDAYGYPPGSIGVYQLDRPDGSHAWMVNLPGTEDWSTVDSTNPWDLEGDLEGMTAAHKDLFAQRQNIIQELIKEALRTVGALPTDDVLITGHSGGGIQAAAAAADPAFLAEVNVKVIVMAGSPARNQNIAPGIDVLDLENEHDIVTAADYGPAPVTPAWVTVTSHRPGAVGGVKDAHSIENYIDDAAALDQSRDPGISGLRAAVNNFMAPVIPGGVVNVKKFVFQGTDKNGPPPQKNTPSKPFPKLPELGVSVEGNPLEPDRSDQDEEGSCSHYELNQSKPLWGKPGWGQK